MQYRYGNAWEEFPIKAGEVWGIPENGSRVAVHNIFDPLPRFMLSADMLFIDPPWNQGNLNAFYTKAGRADYQEWEDFEDALVRRILEVDPAICYIEMGNQFVEQWRARLAQLYPVVQHWPVVYYRSHPTNILRGGPAPTAQDFTGLDEARVIQLVARLEQYNVLGDLCMGQGLVGLAAYKAGQPFVGTELNQRRLANLLQKLARCGAHVQRFAPQSENS